MSNLECRLKILPLALFALLITPLAGCENTTDDHGTQTLEGKMAAVEALMCYQTPLGWVKKVASGQVLTCEEAANNGDVNAQYSLAIVTDMNDEKVQSAKWFRMAAEQGHRRSQLILGAMYSMGEGVPKDLVLAYMWTSISNGTTKFLPAKDLSEVEKQKYLENKKNLEGMYAEIFLRLERQMSTSQIVEAKKLTEACMARSFEKC